MSNIFPAPPRAFDSSLPTDGALPPLHDLLDMAGPTAAEQLPPGARIDGPWNPSEIEPDRTAIETCHDCPFKADIDAKTVQCWGAPPVPVLMGMQPARLAGQPANPVFALQRPQFPRTQRACALGILAAAMVVKP